jgi:hypothetical protein
MRKVKVFKYEKLGGDHKYFTKVPDGEGTFIQYGVDYEEFESGPGNFTTAIVEMPDGTIRNLSVDMIQFIL